MNRIYQFLLMAALVCGLSLGVASCSSNDDEKVDERIVTEDGKTYVPDSLLTEQERYQLACQSAVIGTLRSLAGLESVMPDVVNTTLEPAYGQMLDGEGATVRVVKCESTAEAEQSFRAIASLDSADAVRLYTPTPDGYALNLKDLPILADGKTLTLGTLTFHRDGGPRRYGYVEVDIPCIPHLERIDYLSPDAFPDNAGTNSAYQLGDIVYVNRSSGYSSGYYVCVQPYAYNDGWLVHMCINEPGDDQTINADGDSQGCYYPYNKAKGQSTTYDMINTYFNFICNNQAKVANIKTFLSGKAYNMKPSVSGCLHHIFPEGFNNSNGVPFVSSDGRDGRIWYDAYVTDDYAWVPAYYYRKGHFGAVAHNVRYWHDDSYKYVEDSDWNSKWSTHWNYCMNAIRFTTSTINGSTLEYSPLNDELEMPIYLNELTSDYEAQDGDVLTGTLKKNVKITIAEDVTITLRDVTIDLDGWGDKWAGITCEGDATIVLSGTNTVKGFDDDYPGIFIAEDYTLTIMGDGSLNASSEDGVGIGGGYRMACGSVVIKGGTINAKGSVGIGSGEHGTCGDVTIEGGIITARGYDGAGIGSSDDGSCGDIVITGGTIIATGSTWAAGIGSGEDGSCGDITITNTVTSVTATKGRAAPYSIGPGHDGSCGTVTIGDKVGAISTSPYTYWP